MWINRRTDLGGAVYPFLERLQTAWAIETRALDSDTDLIPTLRWVKDNKIVDLHVEAMNSTDFLQATGLKLSLAKGGFVLSKRISRIFRPYWISGFLKKANIDIHYLTQSPKEAQIWDGAGQIHRRVLLAMIEHLPDNLSARKRARLIHELQTCERIEFTLLTAKGQDKGHAWVSDTLEADFILPEDTKRDVCFESEDLFLGLYPVHGDPHMRLDIQSLINLHPFWQLDELLRWLSEAGQVFIDSVRQGEMALCMSQIDSQSDLDNLQSWHVREYLVSGGHPMWSGNIVKSLLNQHLRGLAHQQLDKCRLPIPGCRYYVMADVIGQRQVARGEITLDPESATAWVNAEDWHEFGAAVWGGADQDDALWCFAFEDRLDGEVKILTWRSPNQVGEYVLLKASDASFIPQWQNETRLPQADSRHLPTRIDSLTPDYLNLVPETSPLTHVPSYSIASMDESIARALSNKGILGQTCNVLMLSKAIFGSLPKQPPAPLEVIIDASVKTGDDLSAVRDWCYMACETILNQRIPVPKLLVKRLSVDRESGRRVPRSIESEDHFLDDLLTGIEDHIEWIEIMREQLMAETMPPLKLFQTSLNQPAIVKVGARLNQLYTAQKSWLGTNQLEQAREKCETYLAQYDEQDRHSILRAAWAHYYVNKRKTGYDECVWQLGEAQEKGRAQGIAQAMIVALREVGILDEIALQNNRLVSYPGASTLEIPMQAPLQLVGVWFNHLKAIAKTHAKTIPESMSDVKAELSAWAKAQIEQMAGQLVNYRLQVEKIDERFVVYTEDGELFAYIAKEQTDGLSVGDTLVIQYALSKNGNLQILYKHIQHSERNAGQENNRF